MIEQLKPINIPKIISIWVILSLLAIASFVVYYLSNHGSVSIETPAGTNISSVSYCTNPCLVSNTMNNPGNKPGITLESGEYSFQIYLEGGSIYNTNINVGRFLSNSTIKTTSSFYDISTINSTVYKQIVPMSDDLLTYDNNHSKILKNAPLSIGEDLVSVASYIDNDNMLVLYNTYSNRPTVEGEVWPTRISVYNRKTNAVRELGSLHSNLDTKHVYTSSTGLYVLDTTQRRIASIHKDGVSYLDIPTSVPPIDSSSLVAFGGDYLAVSSGDDSPQLSPDDEEFSLKDSEKKPIKVTIYSLSDFSNRGEINTHGIFGRVHLSISPDGELVAITGNKETVIYDKKSNLLFSTPSVPGSARSVIWKDNDSFVYQATNSTVNLAVPKSRYSSSIIHSGLINIGDMSGIIDGKLYITGTPVTSLENTRPYLAGYVIDLNKPIIGSVMSSNALLMKNMPYISSEFTAGYHFSDNNLVVDIITPGPGYKKSALTMINMLGLDVAKYQINFINYTNPFGGK